MRRLINFINMYFEVIVVVLFVVVIIVSLIRIYGGLSWEKYKKNQMYFI